MRVALCAQFGLQFAKGASFDQPQNNASKHIFRVELDSPLGLVWKDSLQVQKLLRSKQHLTELR